MENESKRVYVILKDYDEKTIYLRKFWSIEDWNYLKKFFKPEHIIYVTQNIQDEKIKEYNLKDVVWTRIKDEHSGTWLPVKVPISSDEDEMEQNAREETSRLQKQLNAWHEHLKNKNENKA